MALENPIVMRTAGYAAGLAIVTLILSAIALALFFGGAGDRWGPINDVLVAVTLALLAIPVVAIYMLARDATGPWFGVLTLVGLLGIAIAAVGQLVLVAGGISLQTSFMTGGLGLLLMLAWAVGLLFAVFRFDVLSDQVGWLLVAVFAMIGVTTVAAFTTTGLLLIVACVLMLAALVAWLGALALDLLARA